MPYLITSVCLLAVFCLYFVAAWSLERRDKRAALAALTELRTPRDRYGLYAPTPTVSPATMTQSDVLALLEAMRADRTEQLEVIARTLSTVTAAAVQSILTPTPYQAAGQAPAPVAAPVYQLHTFDDDPSDPTEAYMPRLLGDRREGAVVGDDGDIGIPGFRFTGPDGAA